MSHQYLDPVNHKLTKQELDTAHYSDFMDELTDVPSSLPLKPYRINKAGVVNQRIYLSLRSLFSQEYVPILCNVQMHVDLEGHRGIHMSRCIEALFKIASKPHDSLDAFAIKLAKELKKRQKSSSSYVSARGVYLAQRTTRKSNKTSYDGIELIAEVNLIKNKQNLAIGIEAFNMTGCPCTETFTKFSVVPKLKSQGFNLKQIQTIIESTLPGTHTQRGKIRLEVSDIHGLAGYKKLYEVIESSCHLTYELLKRPDEHDLVTRVLRKPQFTEDVVRDVIDSLLAKLDNKLRNDTEVKVVSQLFDSIHIHDVHTEVVSTVGELKKQRK